MTAATLQDELTRLRTGAALCTPDLRFVMRARGGDLLPWLDRICSNPVADIQPGRSMIQLATPQNWQCSSSPYSSGTRYNTELQLWGWARAALRGL